VLKSARSFTGAYSRSVLGKVNLLWSVRRYTCRDTLWLFIWVFYAYMWLMCCFVICDAVQSLIIAFSALKLLPDYPGCPGKGWLEFNVPFQHKYGYIRDDVLEKRPLNGCQYLMIELSYWRFIHSCARLLGCWHQRSSTKCVASGACWWIGKGWGLLNNLLWHLALTCIHSVLPRRWSGTGRECGL